MSICQTMLLLPLAALCLPAAAQEAAPPPAGALPLSSPAAASAPAAPQQGMLVVRDAQTGELRAPTPDEARALQPRTAARAAAPQEAIVTGPGGRRSVKLGERHLVYSVVTRGPDGKLSDQCVHGVHAAESALDHPAPATEEHRHEKR